MEFINPSPVIGLTARSNRLIRPRTQSTTCHDTSVKEDGGGRRKAVLAAASSGRGGGASRLQRSAQKASASSPSDLVSAKPTYLQSFPNVEGKFVHFKVARVHGRRRTGKGYGTPDSWRRNHELLGLGLLRRRPRAPKAFAQIRRNMMPRA